MPDYVTVCEEAARAGAKDLLDRWADFSVREKAPKDLVTEADEASQKTIQELVLGYFPDHGFLGEEGADIRGADARFRWIVDPLDGTANYVHHVPEFTVSVALECEGELVAGAILNPISKECFTAARGEGTRLNGQKIQVSDVQAMKDALIAVSFSQGLDHNSPEISNFVNVLVESQTLRRTGSAALNLAFLAAGRYDGYWATSTKIWDIAAGVLLVQEAGGVVTAPDGGPLDLDEAKFVAAANPKLHDALRSLVGSG